MDEVVAEFKSEAREILVSLLNLLEELEEDPSRVKELEEYGQRVDRIMGGAMSLAAALQRDPLLNQIGACAGLCKTVGYRGSQIQNNISFSQTVIGLLYDMTEVLQTMVEQVGTKQGFDLSSPMFLTMLDRLKWVSNQFEDGTRSSLQISSKKPRTGGLAEINSFLRKLGVG